MSNAKHPRREVDIEGALAADALFTINQTLDKLPDLPDRALNFSESVQEKLQGIAKTIEATGRVSDNQWTAINNMSGGVDRWLGD